MNGNQALRPIRRKRLGEKIGKAGLGKRVFRSSAALLGGKIEKRMLALVERVEEKLERAGTSQAAASVTASLPSSVPIVRQPA